MATLQYVKTEPLSLRGHPSFNEAWLQQRIAEDPSILGLGDVDVLDRERRHDKAGRLDLLLFDRRENTRYEVELMLGATDESHIIRCLEYWDIERRRYPAYDHCAVLVAENITSRFLNILSLFAGTVPLVAIQLSALKIGEQIVLNFVTVLNRVALRHDDEVEVPGTTADREYWNQRSKPEVIAVADDVLKAINDRAKHPLHLNYLKHYIGVTDGNKSRNLLYFVPRKQYIYLYAKLDDAQKTATKLENEDWEAGVDKYTGNLWITLRPGDLRDSKLPDELIVQALARYEEE